MFVFIKEELEKEIIFTIQLHQKDSKFQEWLKCMLIIWKIYQKQMQVIILKNMKFR